MYVPLYLVFCFLMPLTVVSLMPKAGDKYSPVIYSVLRLVCCVTSCLVNCLVKERLTAQVCLPMVILVLICVSISTAMTFANNIAFSFEAAVVSFMWSAFVWRNMHTL